MAQFTKKAIMQCFIQMLNESPMDKISVVDIAERCGINRNTFYYYYCDIYALVKDLFSIEAQRIAEKELSCATWQEVCLEALEFVRENRRAVYHLFRSNHRDLLEEYLYDVAHLEMVNFGRDIGAGAGGFDAGEGRGYQLPGPVLHLRFGGTGDPLDAGGDEG